MSQTQDTCSAVDRVDPWGSPRQIVPLAHFYPPPSPRQLVARHSRGTQGPLSMISASDVVIDDLERWFVECFDTAKIRKRGRLEYDVTTDLIAVKQSQEFVLSHWSRSVGR